MDKEKRLSEADIEKINTDVHYWNGPIHSEDGSFRYELVQKDHNDGKECFMGRVLGYIDLDNNGINLILEACNCYNGQDSGVKRNIENMLNSYASLILNDKSEVMN